ncbi:MAG TPA: rhodanese-like domain-containing protein [Actinomycetota bacterium]|nr:rhodanese-like domain-containing protein [Actinomycetota bacterium]
MTVPLRVISLSDALAHEDAALLDLRPVDEYLDLHIPGSLALGYESGPGMAGRARDCLPLDVPLVLLEDQRAEMLNATAALRGKGFTVLGVVQEALASWGSLRGVPASTDVYEGEEPPPGTVLDVGDPGVRIVEGALRVPVEKLWAEAAGLDASGRYVIVAGYGVRAGLAVGILERAGLRELVFWRTRAADSLARVPLGARPS